MPLCLGHLRRISHLEKSGALIAGNHRSSWVVGLLCSIFCPDYCSYSVADRPQPRTLRDMCRSTCRRAPTTGPTQIRHCLRGRWTRNEGWVINPVLPSVRCTSTPDWWPYADFFASTGPKFRAGLSCRNLPSRFPTSRSEGVAPLHVPPKEHRSYHGLTNHAAKWPVRMYQFLYRTILSNLGLVILPSARRKDYRLVS